MLSRRNASTGLLVLALLAPGVSAAPVRPASSPSPVAPTASSGSLIFVENVGQWPEAARFQVWGSPAGVGTTWLAEDAIWISIAEETSPPTPPLRGEGSTAAPTPPSLRGEGSTAAPTPPSLRGEGSTAAPTPPSLRGEGTGGLGGGVNLKLTFPRANPHPQIEPFNPLSSMVSYFLGDDPAQWRPAVRVWGEVRYVDLYPGVDLVLAGSGGARTWQLRGAPKAAGFVPRLRLEGADGVTFDGGTLRLATAVGEVVLPLPAATSGYEVELVKPTGSAKTIAVPPGLVASVPQFPKAPADDPGDLLYSTFHRQGPRLSRWFLRHGRVHRPGHLWPEPAGHRGAVRRALRPLRLGDRLGFERGSTWRAPALRLRPPHHRRHLV